MSLCRRAPGGVRRPRKTSAGEALAPCSRDADMRHQHRAVELTMSVGGRSTGDVQRVQVRTAEHTTGGMADWQFDDPVDAAIRRKADQAIAAPACVPDITLGVHCRAVGRTATVLGGPDLAGAQRTVVPHRVVINDVIEGIGAVQHAAISVPEQGVDDALPVQQASHARVGIDAKQPARTTNQRHITAFSVDIVLHAAQPQAATCVATGLVGSIAGRRVSYAEQRQRGFFGGQIQAVYATGQCHQCVAMGGRNERGNRLGHTPLAVLPGNQPAGEKTGDIDPVQGLRFGIPEGALGQLETVLGNGQPVHEKCPLLLL
ncbi:hypothetical protein ALQ52_04405 [Pseudomonas cannabina pv. alisalensis]|nr:hypothetical protein ALQ52_04405 [Pseudomonas cannabina pv. alisalensis]